MSVMKKKKNRHSALICQPKNNPQKNSILKVTTSNTQNSIKFYNNIGLF